MSVTATRGPATSRRAASTRACSAASSALRFQRIAGRHQPPDPVEAEPRQREAGNKRVALVRRIERAAEEADAHARRERGQARYSGHASACWASSSA